MTFTDDDVKRLELQAENICAEQMAPMVHMDGHIVKALLARLEASEYFCRHAVDIMPELKGCEVYKDWCRKKGE